MQTATDILKAAQSAPSKDSLDAHLATIETLRDKGYTWREIAAFLTEHGVPTDHSKVFRLATKHERLESETAAFVVPAAAEYLRVLKTLDKAKRIPSSAKAMLGHHFKAHNRTATYTQLAKAAALAEGKDGAKASHRAANMTYGKLGRALGEELKMGFLPSQSRSEPFYSSSIGLGSPVTPGGAEFELVMHHELAKALDELGWF
jgi:hypothetical protein